MWPSAEAVASTRDGAVLMERAVDVVMRVLVALFAMVAAEHWGW